MKEFKVLPTDEKFLSLFPEQKVMLYEGINHLPDSQILKSYTNLQKGIEDVRKKDSIAFIPKGIRNQMSNAFSKRGLDKKEIDRNLRMQGKIKKENLLSELQDQMDTLMGTKKQNYKGKTNPESLKKRQKLIDQYYKKNG